MKNIKTYFNNFINDESGQGATEYILLLVIVVGLALAFKKPIGDALKGKISDVEAGMGQINVEN